ncbi:MAG TPA: DUF2959 family protein [Candidatus Cryosericum sp.]|nr:DUF2959 family protein [Candidatus Cryosericum sp.]
MAAAVALMAGLAAGPARAEVASAAALDSSRKAADLQKKADEAKKSIENTRTELNEALGLYNLIVQGQEKDPRSAHKKLAKILDGIQKERSSRAALWDQMQAKSADFFKGWEAEIGTYTSDSIRQVSQQRLDAAKARYEKMSEALTGARELYSQFLTSFQDQVTLMGRDLGPETIAALQAPAQELNAQAEALKARAAKMITVAQENRVALTGQGAKK